MVDRANPTINVQFGDGLKFIQPIDDEFGDDLWHQSLSAGEVPVTTAITEASPKSAPAAAHEPGIGLLVLEGCLDLEGLQKVLIKQCRQTLACIPCLGRSNHFFLLAATGQLHPASMFATL